MAENFESTRESPLNNNGIQLESSNWISSYTYYFVNKIIDAGSRFPYKKEMLFKPLKAFEVDDVYDRFDEYISTKIEKNNKFDFFDMYKYVARYTVWGGFVYFLSNIAELLIPIIIKYFIKWLQNGSEDLLEGSIIVSLFILCNIGKSYLMNRGLYHLSRGGKRQENCLKVTIY